ncbi:hypothetical protein [Marinobacter sp. ATCH36]|uniref:hypothetical protein n=1 Tax=Marinobacter sp. ATCH36 TaxID=2945106 RepID=UPI002021199B|nr:hypothetical protein [Marinobacter sp. ATCH36]MCL7946173.1 hypothetical protein [Marinobacter sp. ATCH36]
MAGVAIFSCAMATDAKHQGIRVNTLTPLIVDRARHALYDKVMQDPFASKLFGKAEAIAHLDVTEVHNIAGLAIFLASPDLRAIHFRDWWHNSHSKGPL